MTRYRILPYRAGSRGASELARGLGGLCLRLTGSRFRPRYSDVLINWGNTTGFPFNIPRVMGVPQCQVLNDPESIRDASNKRTFFERMQANDCQDIIPRFYTNRADIPDDAFPIVARTILAGHSGDGIVICDDRDSLVNAPLYVEYIKKQSEFRIHVGAVNGQSIIISEQQKKRRDDHANPNWQIRNHQNGFIYARENIQVPDQVRAVAQRALLATNLDFGAVDVIWNAHRQRAYVLEINTAPGITGTTVTDYVSFFERNY